MLKDFDYSLPRELIAQYPLEKRDQARLMIIERAAGKISHDIFSNLSRYLPASSTLLVNDSKVIPARLFGRRQTGGKVEVFLLNKLSDGYSYETMIRPLGKLRLNEKIFFNGGSIYAELMDFRKKIVRFNRKNIANRLEEFGRMPLPPYIKRADEPMDRDYYQTVYAQKAGSVAAPTAGLHFTKPLLSRLKKENHLVRKATLHVNYATFKPVTAENILEHKMHHERYVISKTVFESLQNDRAHGRKIIAVGTTSCRILETAARAKQLKGETSLFIYPGYSFKMTDGLITNFHLPRSTLFMLVCAFASRDLIMKSYREAVAQQYRFYSYGDCMLII